MDMKGTRQGYTIVEVLIFIAVTALIFVAAMTAVGGRQQQVQFAQGLREFEAKIRDTMNDVTTGYYPSAENIQCSVDATGKTLLEFNKSGQKIGTNSNCVYFGKVMQVLPHSSDGYTDPESTVVIYNLVGKRYADIPKSRLADNISEANPKIVASTSDLDTSEVYNLRYGIKITKLVNPTLVAPYREYGSLAILSSLNGGVEDGSSQTVNIGSIYKTTASQKKVDFIAILNKMRDDDSTADGYFNVNPSAGLVICLQDPARDSFKASITVTSSGPLLQIDDRNSECN